MEARALGMRFEPDDHELLEYLRRYDRGQTLDSFGFINQDIDPYGCRPEQLQDVSVKGSYYCYRNRPGRNPRDRKRQTADGSGHWKNKKREPIEKDGQIVGYKRRFEFFLRGNDPISTQWVMKEYTLPPDGSHDTLKAICRIYKTGGTQRNERGQASISDATNRSPLPGSEPCMGSSSHTNLGGLLMSAAAHLGVDYELPPGFNVD